MAEQNGSVVITGKTYDVKNDLKAIGGKWNADNKSFDFTAANAAKAIEFATKHGLHVNGEKMKKPARTEKSLAPIREVVQAVVALPGEKVQVIETPFGLIATQKIGVRLLAKEHLYTFPGSDGMFPDHKGFERLAEAAGVSVVLPFHQRVIMRDGTVMENAPNPYYILDDNGALRGVHAYAVAHGFTSTGKYEFSQASLYYDLDSYLRTVIIKKVKDKPGTGEFCHRSAWDDLKGEKRHHSAWFPIQGDMGVMVHLDHEEIQDIFTTIEDKRQKAERTAVTIVKRIAHSHHLAIAFSNVEGYMDADGECAIVPVTQVVHNSGECLSMAAALLAGHFDRVPGFEVNAEPTIIAGPTELFEGSEEVPSREEAKDIKDADFTENGDDTGEVTDEEKEKHRQSLIEQVRHHKDSLDDDVYKKALRPVAKEYGFKNILEATTEGLVATIAALNEAIAGDEGGESK